MLFSSKVLAVLFQVMCFVEPFRILVYSPRMMQSHVNFVAHIADLLQNNGHEVVVLDNILRSDVGNGLKNIEEKNVIAVDTNPAVADLIATKNIPSTFWKLKNTPEFQRKAMQKVGELYLEQCKHLVLNTTALDDIKKVEKFDFGMHEVFDTCGIGIFHTLGIQKSVILSSAGMRDIVSEVLGIAGPLEDASILSDYGNFIPLLQTRRNLMFHSAWRNFFEVQSRPLERIFQTNESFENILKNANLLLSNSHELSDATRRWSRRVHDIGGISLRTAKRLDKEYSTLLSQPEFSSVVLVSFGTTAPSFLMPTEYKRSFLRAFEKFPDTLFIWKYEKNDSVSSGTYKNVVFKQFLPQVDLLHSGKIKLFISHCGQNSMLETFQAGVRMVAVPLFGDQHRNAKIALEAGLINHLPKESLGDSQEIASAIRVGLQKDRKQVSSNGYEF